MLTNEKTRTIFGSTMRTPPKKAYERYTKVVSVPVNPETYWKLKEQADAESRPIASVIRIRLLKSLDQEPFKGSSILA